MFKLKITCFSHIFYSCVNFCHSLLHILLKIVLIEYVGITLLWYIKTYQREQVAFLLSICFVKMENFLNNLKKWIYAFFVYCYTLVISVIKLILNICQMLNIYKVPWTYIHNNAHTSRETIVCSIKFVYFEKKVYF